MARSAIGLIETRGMVGIIEAADVAVKTADVQLIGLERVGGGLVSLRFCGDIASVQAAVQAAAAAAQKVGELISHHVIARPHTDLLALLDDSAPPPAATQPPPEELESLPVSRLRQLARQDPRVALRGRQVSRANKNELIAALRQARQP